MSTRIIDRIVELAEQEFGVGYLDAAEVREAIAAENRVLFVVTPDGDGGVDVLELVGEDPTVDGPIIGFTRGRTRTFEQYDSSHEFDAEAMLARSETLSKSDFPLFEPRTVAVAEPYQGHNVGSYLISEMAHRLVQREWTPVLGTMWKKSNGRNDHIETLVEFGGERILTSDRSPDFECKICEGGDCDCADVVIGIPEEKVREIASMRADLRDSIALP